MGTDSSRDANTVGEPIEAGVSGGSDTMASTSLTFCGVAAKS